MDKTQNAIHVFNKNAKEYELKFMATDLYHESFDLFCTKITKKNAAILELACGPGNVTRYLLQKRPDFKLLGVDLAPNMLALARINNPEAAFLQMDCREIGTIEKNFDGIICGFYLPYLSQAETNQFIADAYKKLNANGVLYISTMEADYDQSGIQTSTTGDQLYMYFHQADYLIRFLLEHDFKTIDLQRKTTRTDTGAETIDLLIIATK